MTMFLLATFLRSSYFPFLLLRLLHLFGYLLSFL